MRKSFIIAGGIAAAVVLIGIGAAANGGSKSEAAVAPAPVEVTKTVTVTAPPKTVTVTAPAPAPVTVTAAPAVPTVKAAAEHQVTYRLTSSEGSVIDMHYDSGVYDPADPDHGNKIEPVTGPVAEKTVTMHAGDIPSMYAFVGYDEPGKIESCQILVDGVVTVDEKADNKGTSLSCMDYDELP